MANELHFKEGTDDKTIKEAHHEFRKDTIRQSLGMSKEKFNEFFEQMKEFFTLNKEKVMRGEPISSQDEK